MDIRRDKQAGRRLGCALCTALACGGAVAEPDEIAKPAFFDAPRFELDTVPLRTPRLVLSRWDLQRRTALPESVPLAGGAAFGEGVRARVWWGRGKLAFGAGADWTASEPPTPFSAGATGSPRARFALEFRARSSASDLRESLLRVQMSGDAALHFRPRSGGLQVSWRERF
jgi:hypothetical protein